MERSHHLQEPVRRSSKRHNIFATGSEINAGTSLNVLSCRYRRGSIDGEVSLLNEWPLRFPRQIIGHFIRCTAAMQANGQIFGSMALFDGVGKHLPIPRANMLYMIEVLSRRQGERVILHHEKPETLYEQ